MTTTSRLSFALLIVAVAGCGGDPGDAPDAATAIDAFEAPICTKPKVFINGLLGGTETYTPGPDSSIANRSSVLNAVATFGPTDAATIAASVAEARAILEPLGVVVTEDDPGNTPHVEVVLVGTGWPFSAIYASNVPFDCGFHPGGVGLINMEVSAGPGGRGASVAYVVGALTGLEPITDVSGDPPNCMSTSTPLTCEFVEQLALASPQCGSPAQAQRALLRVRLGCE